MGGTAAGAAKARERLKAKIVQEEIGRATLADLNRGAMQGGHVSGIRLNLQTLDEEYVPALRSLIPRLDIYQRMGNDAKIAAQLRANILPLLSAVRVSVEGGTAEMRDLVEQNLLRKGDPRFWCETSWMQRMLEKLMCLHYGFSLHAKTWDVVDGYRIFRRLTYLHPRSLAAPNGPWEWDTTGRLVAVHRSYRMPDGKQVADEAIPVEDIDATAWLHDYAASRDKEQS